MCAYILFSDYILTIVVTEKQTKKSENQFEGLSDLEPTEQSSTTSSTVSSTPESDLESSLHVDTKDEDPLARFEKYNQAWQEKREARTKAKKAKLIAKQKAAELLATKEKKRKSTYFMCVCMLYTHAY